MMRSTGLVIGLCVLMIAGGCRYAERSRSRDVAVRELHHPVSADARRRAINWLAQSALGDDAEYIVQFRQMAVADPEMGTQPDPDHTVRSAAVRALNQVRNRGSVPEFLAALRDEHYLVRMEAAKALNNIPDPRAVDPLIARMLDREEHKDVRIAAAEALHRYRQRDAAESLAGMLDERQFGISWQARRSLRAMTRRDYGYDEQAWREHIAEHLSG
jgi:hypothetical protein